MPKFQIVVECKMVFYRVLIINTPSEWMKKHIPGDVVTIDQKSHPFLDYDSWISCAELHNQRIQAVDQHLREKPKESKGRISVAVRDQIVAKINSSKLFSAEEKESISKSLARR